MSDNPLNTIAHAEGLGLTIEEIDDFAFSGLALVLRTADPCHDFVRRFWTWDEVQAFLDGASWQYRRERGN